MEDPGILQNVSSFYWINDDIASIAAFRERISNSKFAWLVVNKVIPDLPVNCTVIEEASWAEIQKQCLDVIYPLPSLKFMALNRNQWQNHNH